MVLAWNISADEKQNIHKKSIEVTVLPKRTDTHNILFQQPETWVSNTGKFGVQILFCDEIELPRYAAAIDPNHFSLWNVNELSIENAL